MSVLYICHCSPSKGLCRRRLVLSICPLQDNIVSASRSPPGLDMRTVCMRESFECRLHKPYMAPIFYVFFQNYNTFYAQIVNFGSSFGTTSALWCHFGRTLESFLNSEMHLAAKVAPGAPLGALPRNSLTFLEPFWRQFFNIFWQNESFG